MRLGIAGLGNAGYQILPHIEKTAGVELGAVADLREEALESFRAKDKGVRTFRSVDEMCECKELDAVWVATPNEFHAEHTVAAAKRHKHIICEKPMALSLEECDMMIEAAEDNGVRLLIHSKANDPPVVKIREVISSGQLGRLIQINTWNYKGWLRSARLPSEVDTSKGGGVVYRQGAHQVDIVRCIGGGMVKKVRAITGKWNPHFDTEGNFTAFLEFEDGTPATLVFNGYGYFDMTELTWGIGEGGTKSSKQRRDQGDKKEPTGPVDPAVRYAMPRRAETRRSEGKRWQPIFGLTLVSCEKGDIRQSPEGLYVYSEKGMEEILCAPYLDRSAELLRLCGTASPHGRGSPVYTDGRWGRATLEVILAILDSSPDSHEITLSRQVPCPI